VQDYGSSSLNISLSSDEKNPGFIAINIRDLDCASNVITLYSLLEDNDDDDDCDDDNDDHNNNTHTVDNDTTGSNNNSLKF
jgi:hypothetical protein